MMQKFTLKSSFLVLFVVLTEALLAFSGKENTRQNSLRIYPNHGQLVNQHGESRADVLYYALGGKINYYLTANGFSYQVNKAIENGDQFEILRIDNQWIGANSVTRFKTRNTGFNTLIWDKEQNKAEEKEWVIAEAIYPNIDLKWYNQNGSLEYDFMLSPRADPNQIKWKVKGAKSVSINAETGNLIIETDFGQIQENKPVAYQGEEVIACQWQVNDNEVSFKLGDYNQAKPLVIDPVVRVWGTYFGDWDNDMFYASVQDDSLNTYIAGRTKSRNNIATTGAHKTTFTGTSCALLLKMNDNGQVLWSTYFGGTSYDEAKDITIDKDGNLVLVGITSSWRGIATSKFSQTRSSSTDVFVTKFSQNGTQIWGRYWGGSSAETASAVCVDSNSNIYVTGYTMSTDSIGTTGAHQNFKLGTWEDAFIAKFDSTGALSWSTYFGGDKIDQALDIKADELGHIYICGSTLSDSLIATPNSFQDKFSGTGYAMEGFFAKFTTAGNRVWSTYVGGFNYDKMQTLLLDQFGDIYLAGASNSYGHATPGTQKSAPTKNDVVLFKFHKTGLKMWGTYYGGSGSEEIHEMRWVDPQTLIATGYTSTYRLWSMITPDAYQKISPTSNRMEAFIAKFNTFGRLEYGSVFGGIQHEYGSSIEVLNPHDYILVGHTMSNDSISTAGSHQATHSNRYDGMVVKFKDCPLITDSIYVMGCTQYVSPSKKYTWTKDSVYIDTVQNQYGCDSILYVHLTLLNKTFEVHDTVCGFAQSPSGKYTWTSSGTYFDTLTSSIQCDSVLEVHLVVNPFKRSTMRVTSCSQFTSPSGKHTWYSSGLYSDTIPVSGKCDSLISIYLIVEQPSFNKVPISTCADTFKLPSGKVIYGVSGKYTDSLKSVTGCDSVLEFNIQFGKVQYQSITQNSCSDYRSPSGKYLWKRSGIYKDTLRSVSGCDSVITINLAIIRVDTSLTSTRDSLMANSNFGSYQWLNCDSGMAPINFAIRQSFKPQKTGNYALEISDAGCVDTSSCYAVTSAVGQSEVQGINHRINVFPNPTSGRVNIDGLDNSAKEILLRNSLGQVVKSYALDSKSQQVINIEGPTGLYWVEVVFKNDKVDVWPVLRK